MGKGKDRVANIDWSMDKGDDASSADSSSGPLRKWKPVTMNLNDLTGDSENSESEISETSEIQLPTSSRDLNATFHDLHVPAYDQDVEMKNDIFYKSQDAAARTASTTGMYHEKDSKSSVEGKPKDKKSWFPATGDILKRLKDTVSGKHVKEQEIPANQETIKVPAKSSFLKKIRPDATLKHTKPVPTYATEDERFDAHYNVLRQIGTGGHSTVKLALRKNTSVHVVCKFIQSANVWHWNNDNLPLEIEMMRKIKHTNIITLIDHFTLKDGGWIIVMEWLGKDWMDLYDYIEYYGPVIEYHTKQIFKQLVDVLEFMHGLGYSHNDIKGISRLTEDENVMIHTASRKIKLIDFGSARPLQALPVTIFYGTQKFASPEALTGNKEYNLSQQEVWSLGTLLYVLLFKMDPFVSDDEVRTLDLKKRIHKLRTGGGSVEPIVISDDACELLLVLLDRSPSRRPTIFEVKSFPFFD
jgi:Protein kinase domain